ncbi:hypothetical protein Cgig2_006645 [Carnegiea gigantea]|uniref:Uncharacterized protein n=1 Tax=Carnegiea gigantea TaxID=171969 RepID=A0A9Q1JN78_9CARY|nr:hypothetical protein Cgig2_006645 [Carnegiea gigantea]
MTTSPLTGQVEGHNACTDMRVAGVTVATVARLRCSCMSQELSEVVIQQSLALNFCGSCLQMEEYNSCTDVPSAGVIGAVAAPFKCNLSKVRSEAEQQNGCNDVLSAKFTMSALEYDIKSEVSSEADIQLWPMLSVLESLSLVKGWEPCVGQEVSFILAALEQLNCMITKFTFYTNKCLCTRLDPVVILN